jgi:methionyl-tRNA formyltransferase
MKNILIIGGSTPLQKLLPSFFNNEKINIVAVFLNPKEDQSALKFCQRNSIEFFSYTEIHEQLKKLSDSNIDWLFNINSTIILSDEILKIPSNGALNLHPGPLPTYAGLHTHQWAIRNNEIEFGVTLHWMEEGIDTGDIAFQKTFPLTGNETGLSLFMKCLNEGVNLVKVALDYIVEEKDIPSIKQDLSKRQLYSNKMAMDGTINWNMGYNDLHNFFRAADYKPFESPSYKPYTILNGKKLFIEKIQQSNDTNKLEPGSIKLTKDHAIMIGLKDINVIVTPNLSKSDFNNMQDLIDFILQVLNKVQ